MGNMNYCRFTNTLGDLRECYEALENGEELSDEEESAKKELVALCGDITFNYGERD